MNLPRKIKVGTKWYSIEVVEAMKERGYAGKVHYDLKNIRIGKRSTYTNRPFTKMQVSDTFWHEVTHAILHDMGSPLYRSEPFVSAFATRLNKAIETAKF
jgi:hypothetical protein